MTTKRNPRLLVAFSGLLALIAAMLLPTTSHAAAPTAGSNVNISFSATLKAKYKDEHSDGNITYGVTVLRAKTKIAKKKVSVERISVYNYTDGSGPITGFLSLDWKGATHLAFNVTGNSQAVNGTTVIAADLVLFEAQGQYAGYTGYGTMTGTRTGKIGTPVKYNFNITLVKP